MKKRLLLVLFGLLLLFAFYLFSREVKRGFLKQTDFNTTVRLQNKVPARLDEVWEEVAFPVTPGPSIIFIIIITFITIIKSKNWKGRFAALAIPLLFGTLIFGEIYGKSVVHHPAPPFFMIKNPTTIFPTYYINDQFSYPSGHTARVVFIGIVVSCVMYQVSRKRKTLVSTVVIVVMYAVLVTMGRIYLGHHWLSDIIGGTLLGGGFGLLTAGFISPIITK